MNFPPYFRFCLSSIFAIIFTACDPCENYVLQEELAPNGAQKAVVFQRQCGIFGGTSTQVSVLPTSAQPFAGGNIFGADANADQSLEMPSGGPPIAVKWLGGQELQIAYDARVRVFQSEKMLGDVTISYNAQTALEPAPTDSSPKRNKK
jgi:hypothetical protein